MRRKRVRKNTNAIYKSVTSSFLMRKAIKFLENSVLPELDFVVNYGKMIFVIFIRKEDVFEKTNYSLFSFTLGPTYEQHMSEIDFSACATESRFGSKFVESRT